MAECLDPEFERAPDFIFVYGGQAFQKR